MAIELTANEERRVSYDEVFRIEPGQEAKITINLPPPPEGQVLIVRVEVQGNYHALADFSAEEPQE